MYTRSLSLGLCVLTMGNSWQGDINGGLSLAPTGKSGPCYKCG